MNRIRGVVFDLDGTLYTLPGQKIRMSFVLWKSLDLLRRLSSARGALRGKEFESRDALRGAFCEELARRSHEKPERVSEWVETQFYPAFIQLLNVRGKVRSGLHGLLSRLAARGIHTAVVSDYSLVSERLEALGIDINLFEEIYSAEDFGVLKPSPSPLLALARKWEIEPDRVVVVGDREDLDAECARAAGMRFLGVRGRSLWKRAPVGFFEWQSAVERLDKWSEPEDNARAADKLKSGAESVTELNGNHGKRSKQVENINGSL